MPTPTLNIQDKVGNGGTTAQGQFSHTEFNLIKNLLVSLVNVNYLTDGVTIAVNALLGKVHHLLILGDNHTILAPTNGYDGQEICFRIKQGPAATADGGYDVIWDSAYVGSETIPLNVVDLSDLSNLVDLIYFQYNEPAGKWVLTYIVMGQQ